MKNNIAKIKVALENFFIKLKTGIKEIPFNWLLFSLALLLIILVIRFPLEKIAGKFLMQTATKANLILSYKELRHRFPLNFFFKTLNLKGRDQVEYDFYDVDIQLNPGIIFQKKIKMSILSSGFSIQAPKLFVRCNMKIALEINGMNLGLSKVTGEMELQLKQLDFRDLKALMAKSEATGPVAAMLGDKIPKELKFKQISIKSSLMQKVIKLDGKLDGDELVGDINGTIKIREDSLMNSDLQIMALISSKSPIWLKLKDEQMLLKGMNFLDANNDLKIPIIGRLGSPKVNMQLKTPGQPNQPLDGEKTPEVNKAPVNHKKSVPEKGPEIKKPH
jgi:hypothetical protein